MRSKRRVMNLTAAVLCVAGTVVLNSGAVLAAEKPVTLLNVSYAPTRELYTEVNAAFAAQWKSRTGQEVAIQQSHGGSGKQARSVIDVFQPLDPPLMALTASLKQAFDPVGILNPGRMYEGI